jgi:NAD(P)-dependent dehydrogenase (short-subunit alcohol dehydrogenase family)
MAGRRTVVVTGGAAGMGLAAALRFAGDGDDVVVGVRGEARVAPVREAAGAAGVEVDVVVMDVGDDASVSAAFEQVRTRHGDVEVMVANAGVGSLGTLEELTMDDVRAAMEVNYFGVVRTTKAVLPSMRARGRGRLIAVSSVGGAFGQPFTDAYSAAKHAVEGLYESLQPVVARFGVHVSIVEPGPVATEFHHKSTRVARPEGADGDPYEALWTQYETVMAAGAARRQDIEEAAQVIVDVANADAPVLRYQTSKFTSRLVGIKLADLDGTGVTEFTSRWFDPPG